MAKAQVSETTKKKTRANPAPKKVPAKFQNAPKPKSTKIQKASQARLKPQGTRKSSREPVPSLKAREAKALKAEETKRKIGAQSSKQAAIDLTKDTTGDAQPPSKKTRAEPKRKPGHSRRDEEVRHSYQRKDTTRDAQPPSKKAKIETKKKPGSPGKAQEVGQSNQENQDAAKIIEKESERSSFDSAGPTSAKNHSGIDELPSGSENNDEEATTRHTTRSISQDSDSSALSGDAHRELTRQALFLGGWDIQGVPTNLRSCCIQHIARLPSPTAVLGDRLEELTPLIYTHAHPGVPYNYDVFDLRYDDLSARLTSNAAISDDGENAKFCAITNRNGDYTSKGKGQESDLSPIEIWSWSGQDTGGVCISIDDLVAGQPPQPLFKSKLNAGKVLKIIRLPNTEDGGDFGYFIVNTDLKLLAVNESAIGEDMIAGPLPEFALITIGHVVGFWWRTASALDYLPAIQGVKRKRDEIGPHDIGPPGTPSLRVEHLEKRWKNKWASFPEPRQRAFSKTIKSSRAMPDDDIMIGIATVWQAMRLQDRIFAYAGQDVFDPLSVYEKVPKMSGVGVVGGRNRLIMPLMFPSKEQLQAVDKAKAYPKRSVGHLLLAVAEVVSGVVSDTTSGTKEANGKLGKQAKEPLRVRIKVYDSLRDHIKEEEIQMKANDLVRGTSWLGSDGRTAVIDPLVYVDVPQQTGDTCGFHTILNAWAVMLGIPLSSEPERQSNTNDADFYQQGLKIINLALTGYLDTRMIHHFMLVHGLTDSDVGVNASTIPRINPETFRRHLEKQRIEDLKRTLAESDRGLPSDVRVRLKEWFPLGYSDERLWEAWMINNKDVDKAATELLRSPTPSVSPSSISTDFPESGASAHVLSSKPSVGLVKAVGQDKEAPTSTNTNMNDSPTPGEESMIGDEANPVTVHSQAASMPPPSASTKSAQAAKKNASVPSTGPVRSALPANGALQTQNTQSKNVSDSGDKGERNEEEELASTQVQVVAPGQPYASGGKQYHERENGKSPTPTRRSPD